MCSIIGKPQLAIGPQGALRIYWIPVNHVQRSVSVYWLLTLLTRFTVYCSEEKKGANDHVASNEGVHHLTDDSWHSSKRTKPRKPFHLFHFFLLLRINFSRQFWNLDE